MKKIILTLSVIAACQVGQAQITDILKSVASSVPNSVLEGERTALLQGALTKIIGGISPKALAAGTTVSDLLTKVNGVTNAAGCGNLLATLAASFKAKSFNPTWSALKDGFTQKAASVNSAGQAANLATELLSNLKTKSFNSSFDSSTVLSALSAIK